LQSKAFQSAACAGAYAFLSLVHRTSPVVTDQSRGAAVLAEHAPAIIAMWHGQHFMIPFLWPKPWPLDALISKSTDAEINALFLKRFDIGTIRGSGGRDTTQKLDRGGAKALLQLRRALSEGRSVAMIADISHKQARQAGEGIVTLARLTGRPIIPVAHTTSRQHVFQGSWDKAALNLPFGRSALAIGAPMFVAPDEDLEAARARLTAALNAATDEAAALVGRHPAKGATA
jgi:lysophospholipid acyltransferase (LPLAT)-like uncharacterized protein